MKDKERPVTDAYLDKLLRGESSDESVSAATPFYKSSVPLGFTSKYASTIACGTAPLERNSIVIDRLTVGPHDIGTFIENVEKHLGLGEYAPKTNLKKVQSYNAEQLAYFIVHISKTIISGSGDAVQELTEWFNTKTE